MKQNEKSLFRSINIVWRFIFRTKKVAGLCTCWVMVVMGVLKVGETGNMLELHNFEMNNLENCFIVTEHTKHPKAYGKDLLGYRKGKFYDMIFLVLGEKTRFHELSNFRLSTDIDIDTKLNLFELSTVTRFAVNCHGNYQILVIHKAYRWVDVIPMKFVRKFSRRCASFSAQKPEYVIVVKRKKKHEKNTINF